jgi:heterodisulfide reductase subunit A
MAGIGVFICSCEGDIAGKIALDQVTTTLADDLNVVELVEHAQLCSPAGLDMIRETINGRSLDGVLMAACAQDLHDVTFLPLLEDERLAPAQIASLDLRVPGCSNPDRQQRTGKVIERAQQLLAWLGEPPLEVDESRPEIVKRALVIGGGIAGIQAALDIANCGYHVVLVEREPSIGGHMIQLSETFPTLDCSQCILTPRMTEAGHHPRIKLMTYSEVEEVSGRAGHFKVTIRHKPRYIADTCTGCGDCADACPVVTTDQFNTGLRWRKAIYQPFPQAVPAIFTLDRDSCLGLVPLACGKCEQVCDAGAINYDMQPTSEEVEVGAVVVTTGYELYSHGDIPEYGYGKYDDVIDGLQFERLLSASGPTLGKVVRPSDGKVPREVVFIQCVRSRDPARGMPYCSGICCMYTAKHAMLYKHRVEDGQAYVFYMDIRAGGKGYEEFVQRAMEEEGVMYLRGRVSRVFQEDGKVVVWGADTLTGKRIEIASDLVVLATAAIPNDGYREIAEIAGLDADQHGFLAEAHIKVNPVEGSLPGFFLAGCCLGPKDIPATVAQASGAAAKVCALFSGAHASTLIQPGSHWQEV